MKAQKTVKDLENESGKPDSVRNLNGRNARSDKQIKNIVSEFKERLADLTLPEKMPASILIQYADGSVTAISNSGELKQASALLNFGGHL